jgi:hypothetical protein
MGTSLEHMNITACVFGLGDTTYCCGAFTRSATSCFWDLDTVVAVHTIGNDRLCLGSWTLFGRIHTVVDNHLCLGSWTLVVALSHGRR